MGFLEAGMAQIFQDPSLACAATYQAAGKDPVAVRVIFADPTMAVAGASGMVGAIAARPTADILQSAVPGKPKKGDSLVLAEGRAFKVQEATADGRNLRWRMVLSHG